MNGNVHPNPGPIFPCSVCAGNVTWRGKSVQCCTCSKWVHLSCSQLSLSEFRALGSSHSWSCPPAITLWLLRTPSTCIPPLYNLAPPLLMLLSHPTLVSKLLIPRRHILYLLPLPPHHCPLLPTVLLHLLPPLPPHSLRLLQWNAGGLRARSTELLHFLLSHSVDLICIQESNLSSSSSFRIPGFSALRSDYTCFRSGILSPDTTHASGGVFIFVRQGLFFSELSTTSLSSLDPCSDYVGVNISLNNSSLLSFLNVYAPPICSSPMDGRTNSFAPSILPSSSNLFILGDFNCHHPLWDSRDTSDPHREEVFNWVISSDLLPLNDSDTHTHPSPSLLWQSLLSWYLLCSLFSCPFLLLGGATGPGFWPPTYSSICPSSPAYRPNKRPPSFNFQKACWDGFASRFDCHCPPAEEYSSLSFSSAAALFTSLALNAAKSSIPFGHIKRFPKAWWSAEAEKAVSERRKAFAVTHRSDEDCRTYIAAFDVPRQSLPRLRHGRRLALLFYPNLILNLYTLFFALSLADLPRLPLLPTVLLAGNRLRSMPLTWDPTFRFLSQRPCIAEPETTSLSSAEPCALRSLTRPFALLSLPLNFLRLPPTSPCSLRLAQTKLPIPC